MKHNKLNRLISFIALAGIITAWFIGNWRYDNDNLNKLDEIFVESSSLELQSENIYSFSKGENTFYLSIGKAMGYEGPVSCAVVTDSSGKICDVQVIEHTETPSYFDKVVKLPEYFINQKVCSILNSEDIPDAISGATLTSVAICDAVYNVSERLAEKIFDLPIPEREKAHINISFLDIMIMVFFAGVLITRKTKPKARKWIRYSMLILSVIILGFTYNFHLTISRFNALFLGYWPDINQYLAWYLLVFGLIILTIIIGKNTYCHWFCPFGAIQEGIGMIGKAKNRIPYKYNRRLTWFPRLLAWLAIVLALIFKNPGIMSYEVFGKFFTLTGSDLLFVLMLITLGTSVFIKNAWCRYVCPVPPVVDYIIFWRQEVTAK